MASTLPLVGVCGTLANVGYCIPCRFNKCLQVFPRPEALKRSVKLTSEFEVSSPSQQRLGLHYRRSAFSGHSTGSSGASDISPTQPPVPPTQPPPVRRRGRQPGSRGTSKRGRATGAHHAAAASSSSLTHSFGASSMGYADRRAMSYMNSRFGGLRGTRRKHIVDESKLNLQRDYCSVYRLLVAGAVSVLGRKRARKLGYSSASLATRQSVAAAPEVDEIYSECSSEEEPDELDEPDPANFDVDAWLSDDVQPYELPEGFQVLPLADAAQPDVSGAGDVELNKLLKRLASTICSAQSSLVPYTNDLQSQGFLFLL